jgi:hypothetical protein
MNHGASVEHKINQNSRPMTVEALAVSGATDQTGQHVVEYALEIGWNVRALARDATKLKLKHDNLTIIPGDFFYMATPSKRQCKLRHASFAVREVPTNQGITKRALWRNLCERNCGRLSNKPNRNPFSIKREPCPKSTIFPLLVK